MGKSRKNIIKTVVQKPKVRNKGSTMNINGKPVSELIAAILGNTENETSQQLVVGIMTA